jgi:hypothetical protein
MGKPEEKAEQEYADALRWVMAAPNGRLLFRSLLDRLGLLQSAFRSPSPLVRPEDRLCFNGARREFAVELYDDAVKYAPSELDLMQLEARERALLAKAKPPKRNEEEQKDVDEAAV